MTEIPLPPPALAHAPVVARRFTLVDWLSTVDHKKIGILYLLASLLFFVIGGLEALLLRIQLARPDARILTPHEYNQLFTMHGTTMIFLVVVPLMLAFGVYLVPLMIGARDMALPRLNALSFWAYFFGGLLMYYSFLIGDAPQTGWFMYAPLSGRPYSYYHGVDYWALSLLVVGIGTIAGGINFIVTIFTLRAPGLTMRRLPLFVWMTLVNSFIILFALPALNVTLVLTLIDRLLGARFFDPQGGGSAILYQHFFWTFGHPEVYIMVLPAFGIISEVVPVFCRKPIYGYGFVAASTVAIGLLSFGVWVHHMFAVGLSNTWYYVFSGMSMLIAVPTGVKIFNWVATMYNGAIRFSVAMCFATAFLIQFTMGGLTGIMFAAVPIDWQLTDSYFVVAHFHYVLFGGTVFAVMAGTYYWFPKITGRMMSERLGRWHFWLMVIGFNGTFFVQHFLGMMGMPRRVWTYPAGLGWAPLNMISTVGSFILATSVGVLIWNIYYSARWGTPASANPWGGWTLEWATTSPPPEHNFDKVPPVRGRRPLWDLAHPDKADYLTQTGQ